MNQNVQMVQTFLILALCISMAFVLGRSLSDNSEQSVNAAQPQVAPDLSLTFKLNDRINRLELSHEQSLRQTEQLGKSIKEILTQLSEIKEKNQDTTESTQYLQLFQKIENNITSLNSKVNDLQAKVQRPISPVEVETKKSSKQKQNDEAAQETLERQASNFFDRIQEEFFDHLSLRRYDDARFKLTNFPGKYMNTRAGQKVKELLKQIDIQMLNDYEKSEKLAEDYVKNGQIENALQLLRSVPEKFPGKPQIHKRARNTIVRLQEQWKATSKSALYNAPGNAQIQELIEQMGSDDLNEVIVAKKELADIGLRQGIIDIRKATEHENPKIRWGAVALLGQFEDRESEHILITALRDTDPQVRFSALEALEKINSYKAIEEIIKVTGDKDFKIAKRAITSFERITGHKVTVKGIEINENNIESLRQIMSIYWEKNRSRFINS